MSNSHENQQTQILHVLLCFLLIIHAVIINNLEIKKLKLMH